MRKLASIQEIKSIEPIDGADRIELAHVLGWQCVVNKNQFKQGDLAVYFEIDSFLPVREPFEFLRKSSFVTTPTEGFKLRTQKFKGVISQGLLLPVSSFPEISAPHIGDDVTHLLGVTKWEDEQITAKDANIIGLRPFCIPHTEEIRIQAMPELLNEFSDIDYYISTKMDGSSHSIGVDPYTETFYVSGRNYELRNGPFWEFVQRRGYGMNIREFAEKEHLTSLVIQGEFCAPNIQGNKLKLNAPEWYVFTVIEDGRRSGLNRMLDVCNALGLVHVPIEETGYDLTTKYPNVDALLKRAEGEYPRGGKKEGIVIRPATPVYSMSLNDLLSFKVINNSFLLKKGGEAK